MRRAVAFSFFFLLTVLSITAQQAPSKAGSQIPSGKEASPAAPATAQSGALSPSPSPDYSQQAYVVEHLSQEMRFENDGTGREQMTAQIKIVSESGVQALGQVKLGYSAASDKFDIVYLRVRKPDGTVINAQESAIQDLTLPNAPVYTDYHEKHISVPSLRPGDVLEYQVVRTIVNPLTPNQFWLSYNFAEKGIVLDEQLEINVPKARHIKLKTTPRLRPQDYRGRRPARVPLEPLPPAGPGQGAGRKEGAHGSRPGPGRGADDLSELGGRWVPGTRFWSMTVVSRMQRLRPRRMNWSPASPTTWTG